MPGAPHVQLALVSDSANVSVVRDVIVGLAAIAELPDETLDDALTAVSEAVNNVVLHAYDERGGPIEVELRVDPGAMEAVVRDHGRGMRGWEVEEGRFDGTVPQGVGLAAIRAFATRMHVSCPPSGGTEVRMTFTAVAGRQLPEASVVVPATLPVLRSDSRVTISPVLVAGPVLARLVLALGARSGFTIDRLSDAELIAASIAGAAARLPELGAIDVTVVADARTLELHVGPLPVGVAGQLPAWPVGELGGSLVRLLADDVTVVPTGAGEMLVVRVYDRRAPVGLDPPA